MTSEKPLLEQMAEDLMNRDVVTIPSSIPMREAARFLYQAGVESAPVVDEQGRYVGLLSSSDFLRWMNRAELDKTPIGNPPCPYQAKGHPGSEWDGWICVLAAGNCPYQTTHPGRAGRHISVCTRPRGNLADRMRSTEHRPEDAVENYLTTDVDTARPNMGLPELARIMVSGDMDRVVVLDDCHKPVGIVSSTSVLQAMASSPADISPRVHTLA